MSVQSDRDYYFSKIAEKIGGKAGNDTADALADLYTIHEPGMIDWFAGLYNPEVGGWYYSNGARDLGTVTWQGKVWDLRPDIESTEQALRFISGSGLAGNESGSSFAHVIPKEMRDKIVYFLKSLQHPNGFFYHPQWGVELTDQKLSRRARDLGNAVAVIKAFGDEPTYDTPMGHKGNGILANGDRVNLVKRADNTNEDSSSEVAIPEHMKNKEVFLEYLDSLDVQHNSYSAGNTLTAQKRQIIFRDEMLKKEGVDYSLMDILIDYLNKKQFPNGLWHEKADYYGVNGLMKTSGVYGAAGVLLPNSEKAVMAAIDAMTTDQKSGAVTDVYNTWFATERVLRHIRTYGGDEGERTYTKVLALLYERAAEALKNTKEKLLGFKKPDGSYSYTLKYSSARSQGCPVTHEEMAEGDVNATIICSSDILTYIYGALDLKDCRAPIFGKEDMERYLSIIKKNSK